MITSLPLALLVEDMSLYPRHDLDEQHVGNLVQALRSGTVLPPVVADEGSKRIVDGWHRRRALQRILGPQGVIDVDLRPFADEAAMVVEAIRLNAAHGRKLDRQDQVRCIWLAEQQHVPLSVVAQVLHVTTDRAESLRVRVAEAPRPGPGTVTGTVKVALKRPLAHLEGTHLTQEQVDAARGAPGSSYLLLSRQLRDGLRHGLVNLGDARLVQALGELAEELSTVLASLPKAV